MRVVNDGGGIVRAKGNIMYTRMLPFQWLYGI